MEPTNTTTTQAPMRKSKMGPLVTILVILVIILGVVFYIKKNGSSAAHVSADALAVAPYVNASSSFSIQFPTGWKIDQSGQYGAIVFALNPTIDKVGEASFSSNINVTSEPVQAANLGEYIKVTQEALPKFLSDYKTTEDKKVTVDGVEGRIIGGSFTQGQLKLRNIQLVILKNGRAYVITATSMQGTWKAYADVLEASLMTFKIQ
ncbi:MAG: hypothetical protein RJB39_324 [Candidatus Parcubacteria bacterium]|jgi:hypothetical protein